MVTLAVTVTEKMTCIEWLAVSLTCTVKLAGPPAIGVAPATEAVAPAPGVPGVKVRPRLPSAALPEINVQV